MTCDFHVDAMASAPARMDREPRNLGAPDDTGPGDDEVRNTQMEIRPISGALGAEILGVDLAAGIDDETFARIRGTFLERGVIVIRDQCLTPEQHLAVARRFGPINVNRFFAAVDGHPEVAEVRKEPDQKQNVGGRWHTDHSY